MTQKQTTHESAAASDGLGEIVRAFSGRNALVVGDVILDRYFWGDVERTSPEAPVPVVRLKSQSALLGGAANVVSNLVALGASPAIVGVVGADEEADEIRRLFAGIGVDVDRLVEDPSRPTTVKTRVMAMNQQLMRLDCEETRPLDDSIRKRLVRAFQKELKDAEVVIISDYGKGVLADAICRELILLATGLRKCIVVDPKGIDYGKYRGASVIKPNKKEIQEATGIAVDSPEEMERAAEALQQSAGAHSIVVSRGGEGVSVFEKGKAAVHVSAQARSVFDVTGAGDSFVAAMSLALATGASIPQAAEIGNAAGSVVVGKLGAATVDQSELLRALQPGHAGHKVRSAAQLREEIARLQSAGKRVVFTNGCFDLIHLGHIKFLEQARRLGDALIVAINSDLSVKAIKGPPRPVLGEEERAAILAALDFVNYIVVFDEATPERLLETLRPDVLVKGKGLKTSEVVGRKIVERYGGKIELLPLLGEATDAMLEKIARQTSGAAQKKSSAPKRSSKPSKKT